MPGPSKKKDKDSKKRCVLIRHILKYYSYEQNEHSNRPIRNLSVGKSNNRCLRTRF